MIKVPYTVTPDIVKYEGDSFNTIPNHNYLIQKQYELSMHGPELCGTIEGSEDYVKALSQYCNFRETRNIEDIAKQLEEDVAILKNGRLVAICFCFPSGFTPTEKLGMSFAEMHQPVADGELLRKMGDKIGKTISKPGAKYKRSVWTISPSSSLSRLPKRMQYESKPESLKDLYFRTESQITVASGDGETAYFFVKVSVKPLLQVLNDLETKRSIIDSINSMSDATLTYKGLHDIKRILNQSLHPMGILNTQTHQVYPK